MEFELADDGFKRLYSIAKQKLWDPDLDINWQDKRCAVPQGQDSNPLEGFRDYEALSKSDRSAILWKLHAVDIADVSLGEEGALVVASQLIGSIEGDAQLLASTQVADEARHLEFFERYQSQICFEEGSPNRCVSQLVDEMKSDIGLEKKFLVCQVVIEGLALARFKSLRRQTRCPILREALRYVSRDEARHLEFGRLFLKSFIYNISPAAKKDLVSIAMDRLASLSNNLEGYLLVGEEYGWNKQQFIRHLRVWRNMRGSQFREPLEFVASHLKEIGLEAS